MHAYTPTCDELHRACPGLLLRKGLVAGTRDTQTLCVLDSSKPQHR